MLNAENGEILALASHPTFDPNTLDETWSELINDANAPLFNRATQGQYHPGPALGPFMLTAMLSRGDLPKIPDEMNLESDGRSALFVADMATYAIQMARTAWVSAYDVHPLDSITTKEHWQRWAAEHNGLLLMQHDPMTLICRLRGENERYEVETVLEVDPA